MMCAQAAVADTRQTVSIARDRLALARRAVQNDESETGSRVMPNLLRAEDVAEEDKDRVENELNGEERKLDRDEEVAAEAPELAKVGGHTFFLCHTIPLRRRGHVTHLMPTTHHVRLCAKSKFRKRGIPR